jgi:hypothetical protein
MYANQQEDDEGGHGDALLPAAGRMVRCCNIE